MEESDLRPAIELDSQKKKRPYRRVLLTALVVQLAAILLGSLAIYRCIGDDPAVAHPFLRSLWLAVVWPAYLTVMGIPVSLFVVVILAVLVCLGLRWPRLRLLWPLGLLGWGAWWIWCAYVLCLLD